MCGAQVSLSEGDQDCALFVASCKIDVSDQARHEPRSIERSVGVQRSIKRETRDRKRLAAVSCLGHGDFQIMPEGVAGEEAALWVEYSVRVERFQHAFQSSFECPHADERDYPGHQPPRIPRDLIDVRQRFGKFPGCLSNYSDWNIAEAWLLRYDCQKRFDHAWREPVSNDYAVDFAHIQVARCSLDAECAGNFDPFAHSDAERWVKWSASGYQNGSIFECVADRQRGEFPIM